MSKSANFSGRFWLFTKIKATLHYHTIVDLKPLIQKVESRYYTDTANFDRLTTYKIYMSDFSPFDG